jgi:hypothetical protein
MVARLKRIEHWRLAARTIWRGPRTALAGLTGHDLANHPIQSNKWRKVARRSVAVGADRAFCAVKNSRKR